MGRQVSQRDQEALTMYADWMNSLNNTISGAVALHRRNEAEPLGPGPACTANAYIGQFSVQAIDFGILVISLSVLLTVRQPRFMIEPPWWQMLAVCSIPWIPPIITCKRTDVVLLGIKADPFSATVGLAKNAYGPVSGNWCWITANHFSMRYSLTHGWRIAIFIGTIAIYTYIYIYLVRAYGRLGVGSSSGGGTYGTAENETVLCDVPTENKHIRVHSSITTTIEPETDHVPLRQTWGKTGTIREEEVGDSGSASGGGSTREEEHSRFSYVGTRPVNNQHINITSTTLTAQARARKQALRKMLLLNGYPILYVILWIPGIANRIAEAFGTSPVWLRALQASTQLVGLANALTYAYNEQLLMRIRRPSQR